VENTSEVQLQEFVNLQRQKDFIIGMLSTCLPIAVMCHPDFEGDDVIFNLISKSSRSTRFTVVSNDSDFLQLFDSFSDNVSVYNPMKKTYMEKTAYDYVIWKSLCGDSSDNVKGMPGIGGKRAAKLALNEEDLR